MERVTSHPWFFDAKVLAGLIAASIVAALQEFGVMVAPGSLPDKWIVLGAYTAAAWNVKSRAAMIIRFEPED